MCPHLILISQVTSVEKREPQGTFLSLGLQPRLQKPFPWFPFFYLGFKNLLLATLFSTSITWEKPNYTWNIFPESSQNNYSNKILFMADDPHSLHKIHLIYNRQFSIERRIFDFFFFSASYPATAFVGLKFLCDTNSLIPRVTQIRVPNFLLS